MATIDKLLLLQEEKLQMAFQLFDKVNISFFVLNYIQNGTGSISANEVKEVLGVGKKLSNDEVWEDIVREVDLDGDGSISYEEFKTMMIKFLN